MTEDEAKTKACCGPPALSLTVEAAALIMLNHKVEASRTCVGSACMAWRWVMETYVPKGGDPLATRQPTRPSKNGFCGLAGRPA